MTQRIKLNRPLLQSLLVLTKVIEVNDPFSGGHVWRASRYAGALAQAAGFEEGDVFLAQLGALVHDIGKVGIPDAILLKDGRFTEEEHRVIQRHPEIGRQIVANHPLAPLVDRPIEEHHLRVDGEGYPRHKKATEPWIISRVVSIADAFDAMTSYHPFRRDHAVDHALLTLKEERGRQFETSLADTFAQLVRDGAMDHVLNHAADGSLPSACARCGPVIHLPAGMAEGQDVECPSSEEAFVLSFAPDTFDLEWMERSAGY